MFLVEANTRVPWPVSSAPPSPRSPPSQVKFILLGQLLTSCQYVIFLILAILHQLAEILEEVTDTHDSQGVYDVILDGGVIIGVEDLAKGRNTLFNLFLIFETHHVQGDNSDGLELGAGHMLHGGGAGSKRWGGLDFRFHVRGGGPLSGR